MPPRHGHYLIVMRGERGLAGCVHEQERPPRVEEKADVRWFTTPQGAVVKTIEKSVDFLLINFRLFFNKISDFQANQRVMFH